MTAYILIIITFLLAVFGTFYKSTKTDEKGNTIYSKRGFPVLTMAGKAVVFLLTLSFVISLFVTWSSSKETREKEERLSSQLNKVEEQNALLQKEISRTLNPIRDVQISFEITVPLEHSAMASYEKRLETKFKNFNYNPALSTQVFLDAQEYPEEKSVARAVLNDIFIEIDFSKMPISETREPDLVFPIYCGLDASPQIGFVKQNCREKISLRYEVGGGKPNRIRVLGWSVTSDPASWRSSGRIVSVSDLFGAKMRVLFAPRFGGGSASIEVMHQIDINRIDLRISGRYFEFTSENLKRATDNGEMAVYILKFPDQ